MKKLMFATALVASAAAFADGPINAISFEGYSADATVGNTADTPDASGGDNGMYFYFDGEGDGSLVKAFGSGDVAAPEIMRPLYFASASPNANYLELSTEGGILWRSINTLNSDTSGETPVYSLGNAQAVAGTGTYLDTLVQFTPTEDGGAPELDGADKLAIWLNVDSSGASPVTNLMVKAGFVDDNGTATSTVASNYVLSTASPVEAGTWYRLTVKAIADVTKCKTKNGEYNPNGITGFEIYLDGVQLAATSATIASGYIDRATDASEYGWLDQTTDADFITYLQSGKVFPSLNGETSDDSLQGVGFKGSGALDDIVWTTEDPFDVPAAAFTLTWPSGVTPVSYTIDGGTPVSLTGATSSYTIPGGVAAGSTVAFTFTNADGVTKTMSAEATSSASDIDAEDAVYTWADYLGDAVSGAYTIDDANDLDMLRKGVAAGLTTANETFKQTADIDMSGVTAWDGIGTYNANLNSGVSFQGTYDGQDYTISNVDMKQRTYGGVFNQVKGGTIKNLTVDTITCNTLDKNVNAAEWGCAIVGNAGLGATLQNLVAQGSFGNSATPCSHNVAGIAVRVCGGASNVVDGVTMLETLVKDCTNNATLYGFYTKAAGITALTQDQNGVPNDYVLYDGCVNNANIAMVEVANSATTTNSTLSKIGRDGLGGIVGYVSDGTKFKDCVNAGTLTSALSTAKIGGIVGWAQGAGGDVKGRTLDDLGGNTVPAGQKMIGDPAGSTITGFLYATVDNNVATTISGSIAAGGSYLLEGNAAPTIELAAGETIAFDTALGYTLTDTGITAAAGLKEVSSTPSGTVTTYEGVAYATPTVTVNGGANATATWTVNGEPAAQAPASLTEGDTYAVFYTANEGYEFAENAVTNASGTAGTENIVITIADATAQSSGGDDYVVEIEGSDVVVTPSAEDLAAVQAAVIAGGGTLDVTDVAAVNAAMAAPIGTTGIPSWQALFLGLPPTEAGLESFKIDSISIGADGKVTVALPASVDPKTGRGVTITIKLQSASELGGSWTDVETAGGSDNKTFAPVTPGSTDTKKFYKVVVDFAGSSN